MNTVVSQALAVGLPVIATRHSGLPEQVTDGVNGLLVEEGDYAALAARILELLAQPELIPVFSENGRRHVAEHYDANTLAERQIDAYLEVAFGAGSTRSKPGAARVPSAAR